jgi:NAD(P)-dependent dehydrogenase (short-subunit alcohol dehydrogenase family)
MTELRGARALVTGANGGLGRAIATALHQEGCSLVVTGRRASLISEVAASVEGRAVVADLSVRADLTRLLDEAGELDIVVMNAALPASGDLEEWEQADIDKALEVNLANPIAMTRALLPAWRERGWGHFVFVSSLSGKVASRPSTGCEASPPGCAVTCTARRSAARSSIRGSSATPACSSTAGAGPPST